MFSKDAGSLSGAGDVWAASMGVGVETRSSATTSRSVRVTTSRSMKVKAQPSEVFKEE